MSESTTERLNKRLRSISKKDFSDYLHFQKRFFRLSVSTETSAVTL